MTKRPDFSLEDELEATADWDDDEDSWESGYADEPDRLVEQLREDEAIAEADTLLLAVPNMLGVDYNVHVLDSILRHVAPALGWR